MADKQPPSLEYVQALVKRLETKYAGVHQMIRDVRIRRYKKKAPYIPSTFQKTAEAVLTPLIFDFINRSVALVGDAMPVAHVIPVKEGDKAQENSSLRERFFNEGVYPKMEEMNPTHKKVVDALIADGMGVWKTIPEGYKWGEIARADAEDENSWLLRWREHKRKNFPFYREHVGTDTFYPVYDEEGLAEVCEVTTRETLPLARKYNLEPKAGGGVQRGSEERVSEVVDESGFPPTIKFIEYWNRDYFMYIIEGEVIKTEKHDCEIVPYFAALATESSSKNPAEQIISLAYPLLSLQDNIDSMLTIEKNWLTLNGFPTLAFIAQNEEVLDLERADEEVRIEAGKALFAPPGYKPTYVGPPPVSAEMRVMMEYLLDMANRVSLAPILSGELPGASTGIAANTAVSVAKGIFNIGMKNLAREYNKQAAFIQRYIDRVLGDSVSVWAVDEEDRGAWLELGPNEIQGYYQVQHTLNPFIPAERIQEAIFYRDAYAAGVTSMRYTREMGYDIHEPEKMEDERFVEDMRQLPQYFNLVWAVAVEEMKQEGMVSETAAQTGQGIGTPAVIPGATTTAGVVPGVNQPAMGGGIPVA